MLGGINNSLFFQGQNYSGGTADYELWKSGGTQATTALFADLYPGLISGSTNGNSSSPANLTVYNNKLYFTANNSTYGQELYSTDGTNAPTVIDIYAGAIGAALWGANPDDVTGSIARAPGGGAPARQNLKLSSELDAEDLRRAAAAMLPS